MIRIEFEIHTPSDHPAMPGHFPGHPIVPGVLLVDQVQVGLLKHCGMEVRHWQHVKFLAPLLPNEPAQVVCEIEGTQAMFRVCALRYAQETGIASGKFLLSTTLKSTP